MDILESLKGAIDLKASGLGVLTLIFFPFITFGLDYVTTFVSDVMVRVNTLVIDKLPFNFIKEPIQKKQVEILNKSIMIYKDAIKTINKK